MGARTKVAFGGVAFGVALVTACGGPSITQASLVGTWRGDFDASWALGKDGFLKDTLRGAAAYAKDPAEKEKQVRDEMKPIVDGITAEYAADGVHKMSAMGKTMDGKYTVVKADAPTFELEETAGRKQLVTVTFQDANTLHWKPAKGPTLVMRRQ
jgi:hypothetical protein